MTRQQENAIIERMVDRVSKATRATAGVQVKTIDKTHVSLTATWYNKTESVTYIADLSARTLKRGA